MLTKNDEDIRLIGERIKTIREARCLSRYELAKRMNVTPYLITKHERNGCGKVAFLIEYARTLGCTVADLTDGLVDANEFDLPEDLGGRYPYNIAAAVLDSCKTEDLYSVYIPGLLDSILRLKESEQKVLTMRYQHYMTLEQIGEELNVTKERVRQIEVKALRTLRHPRYRTAWTFDTTDTACEIWKVVWAIEEENIKLKNIIKSFVVQLPELKVDEKVSPKIQMREDIAELGLSVRAYNRLRRSGIRTVSELSSKTPRELLKIRGMGRKTLDEILTKLKDIGIVLEDR